MSNRRQQKVFDTTFQAIQSGMKITFEDKLGQYKETFYKGGIRCLIKQVTHNFSQISRALCLISRLFLA